VVVASAVVEDMVRTVFNGQDAVVVDDEATKAREAVFRDTNRVNAVFSTGEYCNSIANDKKERL